MAVRKPPRTRVALDLDQGVTGDHLDHADPAGEQEPARLRVDGLATCPPWALSGPLRPPGIEQVSSSPPWR
jgi:hypothetical protein